MFRRAEIHAASHRKSLAMNPIASFLAAFASGYRLSPFAPVPFFLLAALIVALKEAVMPPNGLDLPGRTLIANA